MRNALVLLFLLVSGVSGASEAPAWVQISNENAKVLLDAQLRFGPEGATQLGVEGYDDLVIDLKPKVYQRGQEAMEDAIKELKKRLAKATDPQVKQDLEILIKSAEDNYHSTELNDQLMLPYVGISRIVFYGIRGLLDPRVSKERQALAVQRLKRYAGMDSGYKPVAQLARDRTEERISDKNLVRPYKGELEQHLSDTPQLIAGIKQLFEQSGLTGWQEAHAALANQLADYDKWVRETLLPQARTDNRLPPAIYADNLKQFGLDVTPEYLMSRALTAFVEIQNEMQALAPLVAKQHGFKSSDYRDVIKELKKKQIKGKAIMPFYKDRLAKIEKIIDKEGIVTLPARKAQIRLASEAESAVQPAPHMQPPRLIGNTGEYGEFVLPLIVPGRAGQKALETDDFTFDAAAWTLTAHEARPGHELQFSAMIERGISTARAVFAANSVNVEGWGLYSEAEMKPYMPLDGQLCSLQDRMLRIARAFLDPMVNLGQMTPEQVKSFLMNEVVQSEGSAQQETDRYTFRAPGQATSYFYGYQRLLEIREKAAIAMGSRYSRKAFNDFVLSQGLLPPALLERAVMEDFVKRT